MQPSSEIWSLNRTLMTKIFPEKLYTKCGGDNIPGPSSQNSKTENISASII